jgi:dienelactone hydrolase
MIARAALGLVLLLAPPPRADEPLPSTDRRLHEPLTHESPRTFPVIASRAEWEARAGEIRTHILVSCGLWPLPERTPLEAKISGRLQRDGYSVENVQFQSYPGFYVAGNLYRPLGRGRGPFPAILNPHGHWQNGRMADTERGSIAARCINFAKQGMIAFSWDMVGYNDSVQAGHEFTSEPRLQLWLVSVMGLQLWNSIRALDFLASLPDADRSRLACTGESGGGTQTFVLGAVDDRLVAQAPVVMVSHSMQGGCLCENAPGLRVEYSNMELAAVPAPRAQMLVAASGDWTKDTLTVEGPAMARIYRLFGAEDRLRYVRFEFEHNFNQTSREAVYEWFGRCLLDHPHPETLKELPYTKEPDAVLRVFPDGQLPEGALREPELIQRLIDGRRQELERLRPRDARSVQRFQDAWRPLWRHALQLEPQPSVCVEILDEQRMVMRVITHAAAGRAGRGDRVSLTLLAPAHELRSNLVVLAHPGGACASLDASGRPKGLARALVDAGERVLLVDAFRTGAAAPETGVPASPFDNFFTTYNRTTLEERVQDLITAGAAACAQWKPRRVVLCGIGRAGLWSLLASPAFDATVADADAIDLTHEDVLLDQSLFAPGVLALGGFAGVASLAAPRPLCVHQGGQKLPLDWLTDVYAAAGASAQLRIASERLADDAIVRWCLALEE